jgi:hypothetical protein
MEIRNWTETYFNGRSKVLAYELNYSKVVFFNKAENAVGGRG